MVRQKEDGHPGIAEVAVPGVQKTFHYTIPSHLKDAVSPGVRVTVSLGRRTVTGYVVARLADTDIAKLKPILNVLDPAPLLTEEMLKLTRWVSDYYLSPWGTVIRTALPAGMDIIREKIEVLYRLNVDPGWIRDHLLQLKKRTPAQAKILQAFLDTPTAQTLSEIRRLTGVGADVVRNMERKGLLLREEKEVFRDPLAAEPVESVATPTLTRQQREAVREITASQAKRLFETFLLYGVTGSGKTEVYLHVIDFALRKGKQAIVIVPEIALTPQLVRIFLSRFGRKISVLHSGLSQGERVDQWKRIRRGEVQVTIGARSAIFAPFSKLGVIVVDEEHDATYKQEEVPKYHARDLAVVRGKMNHATVVLGSATPAVESFFHARHGKYRLLTLTHRVDERPLPQVRLIDMKEVRDGSPLSPELSRAVRKGLAQKEQVLLFLNRRGFAPFLLCATCGYIHRCPNCSVSLTYHKKAGGLSCHHCEYTSPLPRRCPECQAETLELKGCGTEKIEEEVEKAFSDSVLLRLDRDTTRRKGAAQKILDRFRSRAGNILIGTQMVTKGHHLPGITTVGVLNADSSLHHPDFRSAERTFQILTQVAGRAGRGEMPGRVYLQSYTPEHYSLQAAVRQDYPLFFDQEISFRKALNYPPYTRLTSLLLSANSRQQAERAADQLGQILRELAHPKKSVEILGPAKAPLDTLRGKKRFQLLVKGKTARELNRVIGEGIARFLRLKGISSVHLTVDVDPVNFL